MSVAIFFGGPNSRNQCPLEKSSVYGAAAYGGLRDWRNGLLL